MDGHDKASTFHEIFSDPKYDETLIKKYLTKELFEKLLKQQDQPSIIDCIAKVNELRAHPIGVIVLNGNCYNKFSDLFEPIIREVHCLGEFNKYPEINWGDLNMFENLNNESIVFTEISCCRSLSNIPFPSSMNEHDLEIVLTMVSILIDL